MAGSLLGKTRHRHHFSLRRSIVGGVGYLGGGGGVGVGGRCVGGSFYFELFPHYVVLVL